MLTKGSMFVQLIRFKAVKKLVMDWDGEHMA